MMDAESRRACEAAMHCFAQDHAAVKAFFREVPRLLTHFDFPASHWKHIRSTNPIESTFATVKLRTRVTKGAGSRAAGLTMAFKLLQAAQGTWRRLDAHDLLHLSERASYFKMVSKWNDQTSNQTRKAERSPPDHTIHNS
jgi:transposase-like protein